MKTNITAYHIAESINLKAVKTNFVGTILSATTSELFYQVEDKFVAIYNYGAIVLANHTSVEASQTIDYFKQFGTNFKLERDTERDTEDLQLAPSEKIALAGNTLLVPEITPSVIRIVMFDLSQTVAMDNYLLVAEELLSTVKGFASELAAKGKLSLNKKAMNKFIGRSLMIKNKIVDNLYIFDAPDQTWDDEHLDKIHKTLVRNFDLGARFKELEYTFTIVDDNLQMFKELYDHDHAAKLEIIVIVLILVEVVNMFWEKIHTLLF